MLFQLHMFELDEGCRVIVIYRARLALYYNVMQV